MLNTASSNANNPNSLSEIQHFYTGLMPPQDNMSKTFYHMMSTLFTGEAVSSAEEATSDENVDDNGYKYESEAKVDM